MNNDFTLLLNSASAGDREAADRLLPLVYEALRDLAARKMAQETPRHTLQGTALVHEAYLRLVKDEKTRWANRRHFFAAAAEAMRRILIERARRYCRLKHGGDWVQAPFDEHSILQEKPAADLLILDLALQRLEAIDARQAEVVKMLYFAGFTIAETAEALGISPATVKVDWAHARAWLYKEMVALDVDSLLRDEG